jgi:hypothetical protein
MILPLELVNSIIMMSIPCYPFLVELQTLKFIRYGCSCEGCSIYWCHGCYHFSEFNNRDKKMTQILELSTVELSTVE